ncbi:hypothetical protein Vlu01_07680 [Micromonospora lutea]|uniref:Uncharacterized protein n=1 Tax=Micromonospora lutea TaxID=419825 RepID=A0ABQ4IQE5_9ACTN|nr:hypothetical protein Vlu01_07680 [Micromonospora lutea]
MLVANVTESLQAPAGRICVAGIPAVAMVPLPLLLRLLASWPTQRAAVAVVPTAVVVGVPWAIRTPGAEARVPSTGTPPWTPADPPWPETDDAPRTD